MEDQKPASVSTIESRSSGPIWLEERNAPKSGWKNEEGRHELVYKLHALSVVRAVYGIGTPPGWHSPPGPFEQYLRKVLPMMSANKGRICNHKAARLYTTVRRSVKRYICEDIANFAP